MAARCCLTVGADPGCVRIYAATCSGAIARKPRPRAAHHDRNRPAARAYAARVRALATCAAKNSRNRSTATGPASTITAGSAMPADPVRARRRPGDRRNQGLAHPELPSPATSASNRS